MANLIAALDQGTTSSRTIIFTPSGDIVAMAQQDYPQIYPQPDWVEHSPQNILDSQLDTFKKALKQAKVGASDIACIGICNQRETTVIWERQSGKAVANAIVWQDKRTAPAIAALSDDQRKIIHQKTGLVADAYFSASKIRWLLDHHNLQARAEQGELCFGTIDSWLLFNLTNGDVHATDVSNASRTMLWNIHNHQWDDYLLTLFNIPTAMLPSVKASNSHFGDYQLDGTSIPIHSVIGDQQAATFGQACLTPGQSKLTYGTGCFLLSPTEQTVASSRGLLTTIGWQIDQQPPVSAVEGSVFIGGAVLQWLRDGLGIIQHASESQAMAESVPDSNGVMFVPAFAGLGTPYWDSQARGMMIGLTRSTSKAHIVRAALEAIAYQCTEVVDAMRTDGAQVNELRVDGGASANGFLLQQQADLLGIPILRPKQTESTALGAAWMAALGKGLIKIDDINQYWQAKQTFEPQISRDEAGERMRQWQRAVSRAKEWVK
ncbi:glycerol kinase GlpK [Salinibius halmophilus]|uniref:glycerol kinase GlpK n=1 Tax=Salinibius halmophilus TaxID=1853216 RepID=UPI000E66E179|nr:glycerol kinase GlpK [Salinibius halmophilus]